MNTNDSENLDRATSDRLARLRTMPVDTSRLDAALRAYVAPHASARSVWLRPLRAVAASLLVLVTVAAILLSTAGGPVQAAPAQMAQMHQDLVSGRHHATRVDSIEQANRVLSGQWPQSPRLPGVPQEHVMACCMNSMKDKKIACVLLRSGDAPVTLCVADAGDMTAPPSSTVRQGGVTYNVTASGPVNMVMTERDGRWVCLMGEAPAEQLIEFAAALRF